MIMFVVLKFLYVRSINRWKKQLLIAPSERGHNKSQTVKYIPVPPAIMATFLAVRLVGGDFLSERIANWPTNTYKNYTY